MFDTHLNCHNYFDVFLIIKLRVVDVIPILICAKI